MTEKTFTVEEMQNWNKRFKISKEDDTKVIDTFDDAEFWTVHGNEAYNLCILLNEQDQEIQKYRDGFYKAHEMYQELLKQLSETKKERDEAIFKQKTLEKWYTCPTCGYHNKEIEYLKSLRKKD